MRKRVIVVACHVRVNDNLHAITFSPCFSIQPSKGILNERETIQLIANFSSDKSGDFKADLLLNYESGIETSGLVTLDL